MSREATRKSSDPSPKPPPLKAGAIGRGLLAGVLTWLLPGLGHWYLGRRLRAVAFFALIGVAFGMGLACDGNLAVVDDLRAPVLTKLQVLADLALGPIEPMTRKVIYGELVYRNPRPGNTHLPPALEQRRQRSMRRWSLYGSSYLLAAGLMNILLIFDAWDIGIGRKE
ncbi:MAG TPA: hypothetical protein ENK10_09305 [Acidobacteria bacterium]|nr:hypothetical protein [Acidobacteriota bacterium]